MRNEDLPKFFNLSQDRNKLKLAICQHVLRYGLSAYRFGMGDLIAILTACVQAFRNDEFTLFIDNRPHMFEMVKLFQQQGFLLNMNIKVVDGDLQHFNETSSSFSMTNIIYMIPVLEAYGSFFQICSRVFGQDNFHPLNFAFWKAPSQSKKLIHCCYYCLTGSSNWKQRDLSLKHQQTIQEITSRHGYQLQHHHRLEDLQQQDLNGNYTTYQYFSWTTLSEQIEHMLSCDFCISIDTGVVWMSALIGIPTIGIFKRYLTNGYSNVYDGWKNINTINLELKDEQDDQVLRNELSRYLLGTKSDVDLKAFKRLP